MNVQPVDAADPRCAMLRACLRSPDILAWYAERHGPAMQRLGNATGDDLLRVVDFYGIRSFPAIGLIQLILNHTIHHRGQLSTYLRPIGAKVPSIYGPSYDAGGFSGAVRTGTRD